MPASALAVATPRPQGLAGRLPALAPDASQALRALFARPLAWTHGPLELRIAPSPPGAPLPAEGAVLESSQGSATLWVASTTWRDDAGDRPWHDFQAESRLLGWALAHETLLGKLGAVLGCDFSVGRLVQGAVVSRLTLHWSLREGDQRAEGWIKADAGRWLGHWLPLAQPRTLVAPRPTALRAQVQIGLVLPAFPFAELRPAVPGDVLVLGPRDRLWSSITLRHGSRRWLAAWSGGRLRVTGALDPFVHLEEPPMSASAAPPDSTASNAPPAAVLDGLSVDLTLVLGNLSVPLSDLAQLSPGYVLDLPNRLDQAHVLLQSGGRTVGRGELVAVGETLGVQITELKLGDL